MDATGRRSGQSLGPYATRKFLLVGQAQPRGELRAPEPTCNDRQPPTLGGFHGTACVVEMILDGGLVPSPDRHPSKAP